MQQKAVRQSPARENTREMVKRFAERKTEKKPPSSKASTNEEIIMAQKEKAS